MRTFIESAKAGGRLPSIAILIIVALVGCSGCPQNNPQPSLVFTEYWPSWGPHIVDQLHSGALSLDDPRIQSDLRSASQCTFAVDPGASSAPQLTHSGQPGGAGFNVKLDWSGIVEASGLTQPCTGANLVSLVTMYPNPWQGPAINVPMKLGVAEFNLGNNAVFSSAQGIFEFTLTSFERHSVTASYRYVMTNPDPRDTRVLVITGSFLTLR